jgi:hypothetical protein
LRLSHVGWTRSPGSSYFLLIEGDNGCSSRGVKIHVDC